MTKPLSRQDKPNAFVLLARKAFGFCFALNPFLPPSGAKTKLSKEFDIYEKKRYNINVINKRRTYDYNHFS